MLFRPVALLLGILILAGCAAQARKPTGPCVGKKTAAEAIATLNSRREHVAAIRATGQCLLRYHAEGKRHKENFPVKLWVNPPDEIYLQGDVAFNATGLVFGSNADEFWFWLRPKEISSYWWGRWTGAGNWDALAISPAAMLEAFGTFGMGDGDWSLLREANRDVLVLRNGQGNVLKRCFIEPCDYLVEKIEYFDSAGTIALTAKFDDYDRISEGYSVPELIKIVAPAKDGDEDSVRISLGSIKPTQLSEQQKQRLFVRPKPRGFEHVYQVIDGTAVEQIYE